MLDLEETEGIGETNPYSTSCPDCGVPEGEYHLFGCDREPCPFCGMQLIGCGCCYEHLGLINTELYGKDTSHLPPSVYKKGLSKVQKRDWETLLRKKGRVRFIEYPLLCARCGTPWPDFFMVADEDWDRYIQIDKRREVICLKCYAEIVRLHHGQSSVTITVTLSSI